MVYVAPRSKTEALDLDFFCFLLLPAVLSLATMLVGAVFSCASCAHLFISQVCADASVHILGAFFFPNLLLPDALDPKPFPPSPPSTAWSGSFQHLRLRSVCEAFAKSS